MYCGHKTKIGEVVFFRGSGGTESDQEQAKKEFYIGRVVTVVDVIVHRWETQLVFQGVAGSWNSVMFAPVAASQPANQAA